MILTYISREPLGIEDSTNEFIQSKKSEEDSNTNAVMAPARREAEKVNQDLDTSEDDRDKPLTILQLSPRKRPAVQDDPYSLHRVQGLTSFSALDDCQTKGL